jgi:hypothetical protein
MLGYTSEAHPAGRWRTRQQSRQDIIDAARERVTRDGYERATDRAITDAGVDIATRLTRGFGLSAACHTQLRPCRQPGSPAGRTARKTLVRNDVAADARTH